jgi:hypothetical protein
MAALRRSISLLNHNVFAVVFDKNDVFVREPPWECFRSVVE